MWTGRTEVTSDWRQVRLGGAYLLDHLGNYILTNNNERIVIIVPGGRLPTTNWKGRANIS